MTVVGTHATPAATEHLLSGLVPGLIALGLPCGIAEAARALGVQPAAFVPMQDGSLQAEFDFPRPSLWRVWPERGVGIWIGADQDNDEPPVQWAWRRSRFPVAETASTLAALGIWLQEALLLTADGWHGPFPGTAATETARAIEPIAIAGTWSLIDGHAVRGVVFDDGRAWGETPQQTEQWLLALAGSS